MVVSGELTQETMHNQTIEELAVEQALLLKQYRKALAEAIKSSTEARDKLEKLINQLKQ